MEKKTNTMDESMIKQFVSFTLGNEAYGMNIMLVESIERISGITPVPKTPDYVLGVTNIRGEIIPVINLRKRLGMQDREYDDNTRIIISRFDGYRIGIVVDMVNDIVSVSESDIQMGKDIFKDRKNDLISQIVELHQDYILVLDIYKVLNLGE